MGQAVLGLLKLQELLKNVKKYQQILININEYYYILTNIDRYQHCSAIKIEHQRSRR